MGISLQDDNLGRRRKLKITRRGRQLQMNIVGPKDKLNVLFSLRDEDLPKLISFLEAIK